MINIEWDHYPWYVLLEGITVLSWLTVAKSHTGKFHAASSSSRFPTPAGSASARGCARSARIDWLRNRGADHLNAWIPPLRKCRGHRILQPEPIPSRYGVIATIAIQIIAPTESDRVRLQKAAHIGRVKAMAQIIKTNIAIPLLAGEKMAHAEGRN